MPSVDYLREKLHASVVDVNDDVQQQEYQRAYVGYSNAGTWTALQPTGTPSALYQTITLIYNNAPAVQTCCLAVYPLPAAANIIRVKRIYNNAYAKWQAVEPSSTATTAAIGQPFGY